MKETIMPGNKEDDTVLSDKNIAQLGFLLDADADLKRSYDAQLRKKGSVASVLADDPGFVHRHSELIGAEIFGNGSFMNRTISGNVCMLHDACTSGEKKLEDVVCEQLDVLGASPALRRDEVVTVKGLKKAISAGNADNMKVAEAIEPIGQRVDLGSGDELDGMVRDAARKQGCKFEEVDENPIIDRWLTEPGKGTHTEAANAAGTIYGLYIRRERDERIAAREAGPKAAVKSDRDQLC